MQCFHRTSIFIYLYKYIKYIFFRLTRYDPLYVCNDVILQSVPCDVTPGVDLWNIPELFFFFSSSSPFFFVFFDRFPQATNICLVLRSWKDGRLSHSKEMLEALCWIYLEHAINGLPARFYYYAFLLACFFLPFTSWFYLLPIVFILCSGRSARFSSCLYTNSIFGYFCYSRRMLLMSRYQQLPVWRLDRVFGHSFLECVFVYLWEKEERLTAGAHWRRKRFSSANKKRRALSLCLCDDCVLISTVFYPFKDVAVMCSAWLCWRIPHFWMMHSKFFVFVLFLFYVLDRGADFKRDEPVNYVLGNWLTEQVFNRQLPTTYLAWSIATCCYYLKDIKSDDI
jgi:hypothetical protein